MTTSAGRVAEALRRADGLQSTVNELQAKCKDLEAQLQGAKQNIEDATLKAAERELQARRQAEAEASHMYRQLRSEHEVAMQAQPLDALRCVMCLLLSAWSPAARWHVQMPAEPPT